MGLNFLVGGEVACSRRCVDLVMEFAFGKLTPAATPPEEVNTNTLVINRVTAGVRGCTLADRAAIEAAISAEPKLVKRNVGGERAF